MEEKVSEINSVKLKDEALASYHVYAPKGWINDPNGIIYFNDSYRIFFQYNPYENYWKDISIGVAKSKDLLKFDSFKVALAPNKEVDGIFSGSVISNEEGLNLIFTNK